MILKKLLTNKLGESLLIGFILLFRSKDWVYKFVPSNNLYKNGTIRNVKRNGIFYSLDISDYQEWLIFFYCKSDSSEHVLEYLGRSIHVFDIGANIGQTAFNMAQKQKMKGLNAVIHAFEPYPRTFEKLKTTSSLNQNIAVKAYNLGLGEEKGKLYMMQHSPSNSGGFRMTEDKQNSVEVAITTFDAFISEQEISAVDFIKIDVEGFEVQVLKGALQSIKKFRPLIIFEYSLENILAQGGDIKGILKELQNMNYKIKSKEGIEDLNAILELPVQTDLICIPN